MSSDKELYLNMLFGVITDPEKRKFTSSLELDMLRLMVTWNLQSDEWTHLKTNEQAYNIRSLYHRRVIDKGSNSAIRLDEIRSKFTSNPNFLSTELLLNNTEALKKAGYKILSQHPQRIRSLTSNFGLKVVGGIANQDGIELLIEHDQYFHSPDVSWPVPIRSEDYNIPKLLKRGELYINGNPPVNLEEMSEREKEAANIFSIIGRMMPTYRADIFFTMESLDLHNQIWDVVFE